jgi:hypothetical protein
MDHASIGLEKGFFRIISSQTTCRLAVAEPPALVLHPQSPKGKPPGCMFGTS